MFWLRLIGVMFILDLRAYGFRGSMHSRIGCLGGTSNCGTGVGDIYDCWIAGPLGNDTPTRIIVETNHKTATTTSRRNIISGGQGL